MQRTINNLKVKPNELLEIIDDLEKDGSSAVVFIVGRSGCGKSLLIEEANEIKKGGNQLKEVMLADYCEDPKQFFSHMLGYALGGDGYPIFTACKIPCCFDIEKYGTVINLD